MASFASDKYTNVVCLRIKTHIPTHTQMLTLNYAFPPTHTPKNDAQATMTCACYECSALAAEQGGKESRASSLKRGHAEGRLKKKSSGQVDEREYRCALLEALKQAQSIKVRPESPWQHLIRHASCTVRHRVVSRNLHPQPSTSAMVVPGKLRCKLKEGRQRPITRSRQGP